MNIKEKLIALFESETGDSLCDLCWGYQKYDG